MTTITDICPITGDPHTPGEACVECTAPTPADTEELADAITAFTKRNDRKPDGLQVFMLREATVSRYKK